MKVTVEFEYKASKIGLVKLLLKAIHFGINLRIIKIERNNELNDKLPKLYTIPFIKQVTSEETGILVNNMSKKTKKTPILEARYIAMYYSKLLTKETLQTIGNSFGGRDHATVLHAIKKTNIFSQSKSLTETDFKLHFKRVGDRLKSMI